MFFLTEHEVVETKHSDEVVRTVLLVSSLQHMRQPV